MSVEPHALDAATLRIVTHMNNDHHDSLVRYLEYYASTPSYTARTANMLSLSLAKMTLTTKSLLGLSYSTIALEPPLKSLSEARERLVAMDKECIKGLKRDPITVKEYQFPRGADFIVALSCLLGMIIFANRDYLDPTKASSGPFAKYAAQYPDIFRGMYNAQPKVFYGLVGAHLLETLHLHFARLSKHSVPTFSGLWWKWIVNMFIEGFTARVRLERIVKKQKEQADKHK